MRTINLGLPPIFMERDLKSDREFFLSIRICPVCRKERLYEKERICPDCKIRHAEYCQKYYKEHKEKLNKRNSEYKKSLYLRRKEQGLCVKCGSKFLKPGTAKCYQCCEKDRLVSARYLERKKVLANG